MPIESVTLTSDQFAQFSKVLVSAFREVMEPAAMPRPELVTVGETSDVKLDAKLYCAACLGERGPRWNSHGVYFWGFDPDRPEVPKRNVMKVMHPDVRKTISYDAQVARAGLASGTHGKQCLQCGTKLPVLAA